LLQRVIKYLVSSLIVEISEDYCVLISQCMRTPCVKNRNNPHRGKYCHADNDYRQAPSLYAGLRSPRPLGFISLFALILYLLRQAWIAKIFPVQVVQMQSRTVLNLDFP